MQGMIKSISGQATADTYDKLFRNFPKNFLSVLLKMEIV